MAIAATAAGSNPPSAPSRAPDQPPGGEQPLAEDAALPEPADRVQPEPDDGPTAAAALVADRGDQRHRVVGERATTVLRTPPSIGTVSSPRPLHDPHLF